MSFSTPASFVAFGAFVSGQLGSAGPSIQAAGQQIATVLLSVTVAPSVQTEVQVWAEESLDGTNWSNAQLRGGFSGITAIGGYMGNLPIRAPYTRFRLQPTSADLTASMSGVLS